MEGTNYPLYRKQELKRQFELCYDPRQKKFRIVKVHGKDEPYSKFAEVRGIYSRHDIFKVLSGPLFAAIGKKMFKHEYFFKNVKTPDKVRVFLERMSGQGSAWETDHTSFEASFRETQFQIEFDFYRYCCQGNPEAMDLLQYIEKVITGVNSCRNKYFKFNINARRQSGEMNTSLGNSYYNLVLGAFVAVKSGNTIEEYLRSVLIEGDDGVARTTYIPDPLIYAKLGHIVKLESHINPCHASFCGMIFDPDDKNIVVSPIEKILEFGWTGQEYVLASDRTHRSLIKARSMSLLYSYPGCPMVAALARKFYELTYDADASQILKSKTLNTYERDKWTEAIQAPILFRDVGLKTRILVEEKFGLPISLQMEFEAYVSKITSIQPLNFPKLLDYCKPEYTLYQQNYSLYADISSRQIKVLSEKFL